MIQLLVVGNVVAVDTIVHLGQLVVAAVAVDYFLDLCRVELLVGEDGQIMSDGADNTIAAEDDDAVGVSLKAAHDARDIGGIGLEKQLARR